MDPNRKWLTIIGAALVLLFAVGAVLILTHARAPRDESFDQWLRSDPAVAAAAPAPAVTAPKVASAAPAPMAPAAPKPFVIKRVLPIDGPIKYGEWHWDDKNVPAGPIVVTVDLEARVMSVFKDGYEIGATAVMLGTDNHPTPLGVFPILAKERYNTSSLYGDAPMPWTLRLTNDGVAIHGGHEVEKGFASHGCIGTPNGFVSKLFAIAKPGDKVIITRGKTAGVGSPLI